jgi:DNA-binding transcriptional regulator LsrR (DeoR family)
MKLGTNVPNKPKTHINQVPLEIVVKAYELIYNGGTLAGVAERFGINRDRLGRAIRLAKQNGVMI